jgi:hypothetical protein
LQSSAGSDRAWPPQSTPWPRSRRGCPAGGRRSLPRGAQRFAADSANSPLLNNGRRCHSEDRNSGMSPRINCQMGRQATSEALPTHVKSKVYASEPGSHNFEFFYCFMPLIHTRTCPRARRGEYPSLHFLTKEISSLGWERGRSGEPGRRVGE